jgi:nitrate reductase NapE component
MLSDVKRRLRMSPLMLMMLLTLVPFPILAIAIVADRWRKPASKAST